MSKRRNRDRSHLQAVRLPPPPPPNNAKFFTPVSLVINKGMPDERLLIDDVPQKTAQAVLDYCNELTKDITSLQAENTRLKTILTSNGIKF